MPHSGCGSPCTHHDQPADPSCRARAGWRSLWKGNLLNIARTAPFKAVNYFTFDRLMAALVARAGGPPPGPARYLAGAPRC